MKKQTDFSYNGQVKRFHPEIGMSQAGPDNDAFHFEKALACWMETFFCRLTARATIEMSYVCQSVVVVVAFNIFAGNFQLPCARLLLASGWDNSITPMSIGN